METFDDVFENILYDTRHLETTHIYQLGIETILQTSDIAKKENILAKLLFLFPARTELYYFMGYIFRDTDMYKSLMWYNICMTKDHKNTECVLELMKLLFDHNYLHFIYYLNEKYDNVLYKCDDDRILVLLGAIHIKEGKLSVAGPIMAKLLEKAEENADSISGLIPPIYINSSFLLGKLTNIEAAMVHIKKIMVMFSGDTAVEDNYMRTAFENYSLLCDYVYTDLTERFEHCKKINYFYPSSRTFTHPPPQNGKIKIGYVSNAFQDHAVSNFILPILDSHDTELFEVFLFTHHVYKHEKFPTFNINKKSADVCAKIIYDLGITILIDIDGHTSGNRLDIFSKNPAPIQITYLGFPNSTAMDFMQYRITDAVADHPDSKQPYSETRLYLPRCFLLYKTMDSLTYTFEPKPLGSTIVLGSLNKEPKNSKHVLESWKQILHSTTNTKLLIKISSIDNIENRIAFYKQALDVEEDRLIIVEFCSNEDYMKLFHTVDILLDTYPYSGTTTTCHALAASTPVVTLYHKDYHAHNVSSSLLIHSGFPELVSYSDKEYIEKVVELCNRPDKIAEYKTTLRPQFLAMMEPKEFMKEYEQIMINLYHKFRDGEPA
jgi:predicted O-linked N-acetylglucosamine transferase (SPINDLY family)